MKKALTMILSAIIGLMEIGCKEEKCEPYASDDLEISWTDYNTVKQVWDYFGCHEETCWMHTGDTFKVMGYPLRYAAQTGPFEYDSNARSFGFFFGDNWKKPHNQQTAVMIIDGDSSVMSCFRDYSWGRKVYFTVTGLMFGGDYGCCWPPHVIEVIDVKFEGEEN